MQRFHQIRDRLASDLFAVRQEMLVIDGQRASVQQWDEADQQTKSEWIEHADEILSRLEGLPDTEVG